MKEQLQQQLNLMINNNENKKVITVEESEKQIESFLDKYGYKIENLVIQKILYRELRNEGNKTKEVKQEQIKEEELLKIEKEIMSVVISLIEN